MTLTIRRIEARDEARWRELWDGYTRFYEREPAERLTRHTWARIMDAASPVYAIVAENEHGVVGIANYIIHENASALTPVCYLQDLFVDPGKRGGGVGQALMDWLGSEMGAGLGEPLLEHPRDQLPRPRPVRQVHAAQRLSPIRGQEPGGGLVARSPSRGPA